MIKYIVKRLGIAVVMILGVTMIIFCIIRMQPGNPFLHMVQADTNAEFMEAKLREIGYYDPLPIQYGKWLLRTLHFDLGYSIQYNAPVSGLICVSIPVFFFGLLLIKIFGYDLKILPFSGIETLGTHYTGAQRVLDIGKHLILPMTASAMTQTATLIRYTRASLMETVSEGYIDTAMAKGLTRKRAIIKHGMKNAKISIISVLCNKIPDLLSGALIVETVFVWPGLGQLNYQAILQQDYPLIMGITLLIAVIVIICNLLADILYMIVDPRIRYEAEK